MQGISTYKTNFCIISPFSDDSIDCLHHSLIMRKRLRKFIDCVLFLISVFIRRSSNKPESPQWNVDKELRDKDTICKHVNGKNFGIILE